MNKAVSGLIDTQTEWFEGNMRKIARRVRNRLNTMLNQFDRSGGSLINTPDNINRLNALYGSIIQELTAAGYTDLVASLNEKENELLAKLRASRPAYAVPLAFTETSQAALAAFNSMWNARIGNLGMDISRQIHGIVSESVFSGRTTDSLIQGISKLLDDDFVRYATTYVNTSRAKFIQMAEYEAAKSYDGEMFWIYEGPQDDITRPVCREGTGMDSNPITDTAPYYTDAERIDFENYSGPERLYNCRHSFMLISPEYYRENTGTTEGDSSANVASGGDVRQATGESIYRKIDNAKTENDFLQILETYGAKESRVYISNKGSIENARNVTRAVVDIGDRYGTNISGLVPKILINNKDLSRRTENATYWHSKREISTKNLSKENIAKQMALGQKRAAEGRKAWTIDSGDLYGITVHEYGHAIDRNLIMGTEKDKVVTNSWVKMVNDRKDKLLRIKSSSEYQAMDSSQKLQVLRTFDKEFLTEYGMSKRTEYFAESFAAWHAGKLDIMDKAMIDLFDSLLGGK